MGIRTILATTYLLLQIVMLVYARIEPDAYFHWAPFDTQSEYRISVKIDGRVLSSEEVSQRYQEPSQGIDFHSIEHLLQLVRQYESTYGKKDKAIVMVRYRINGGAMKHWLWPTD
jgi:hypothetical protein